MNAKRLMAMGLVLTLGMSAAACGSAEPAQVEEEQVAVEVMTPEAGELAVDSAYIGTVAPQQQVYVIPKVSGTVTETNFSVGDTVQEGDVLFQIDDEAARLQLASAQAAYDSAQAGVTAQSSGARDLQNFQTEQQIQTLKDSLYDTDDQIADMEDDLGDLRDSGGELAAGRAQAQAGVDGLDAKRVSLEAELQNQQEALKKAKEDVKAANPGITEEELEQKIQADPTVQKISDDITGITGKIAENQLALNEAKAAVSRIDTRIASVNATKTQLKSGIDQLEAGRETINENLSTAEQAYGITQNQIYPESDAVSQAQLQAASVGIDSAQMQLEFYTVEAPISGVIDAVNVEKEGMASAGNPAYIISNKESMTVTFFVAEKAKNALSVGDHVQVERNGEIFDGSITEVGTMANAQTKLFQVKASVPGASESLPNGVSVKVHATTQKEDGKLLIPYDAVYFSAGEAYVYCVEEGALVKTAVETGLMSDDQVAVESGLTEESQVVTNWSSRLRDGVKAEVVSVNGEPAEDEAAPEEAPEEEVVE